MVLFNTVDKTSTKPLRNYLIFVSFQLIYLWIFTPTTVLTMSVFIESHMSMAAATGILGNTENKK